MSIEKYLDEEKAKRYLELVSMGVVMSYASTPEYEEYRALVKESIAKQIEIYGEPTHTPFDGKCRRCGAEFTDPTPKVTKPDGIPDIACKEWCPGCNSFVMNIIFRGSSAYDVPKQSLIDPTRGGHSCQ